MWICSIEDFTKNDYKQRKMSFKTEEEAVSFARETFTPLIEAGFEQHSDFGGRIVGLTRGDDKYSVSVYQVSSLEKAPEIVVNTYTYDERYYLEVMHDFERAFAALYIYDAENPDIKIAVSKYDLNDDNISDEEILASEIPDLDNTLQDLALLNDL